VLRRGSPFLRKLLAGAFLVLAFALVTLDFYLTRYTASRETHAVERRLTAEARLLASEFTSVAPADLVRLATEADRRAEARITLIDPRGVVLADSRHDPESMENHAHRPEVREALQGRIGTSVRHSATLNRDFCYVAYPFTYRGQAGFALRLAVPLEDLDSAVSAVRRRIIYASAVTAGLALILAYLFSIRISRRISRLQKFAQSLLHSEQSQTLIPEANDELGALSRALNDMGQQLRELIERLQNESSRREAILSSMVEGVLAVDAQLHVLFCNDAFRRALNLSGPVAAGTPLRQLARDPNLIRIVTNVLDGAETVEDKWTAHAEGTRVFEVQALPLVVSSNRCALVIFHDITRLERLERVRQDFVANVSHELRTPVAAILGYSDTLLDGGLEDRQHNREFLQIIRSHAIRLTDIAADLLTLATLDANAPASALEHVSLRALIETAVQTMELEARARHILLAVDDFEDVLIVGERVKLEQAFLNLISNAVKFNRQGGQVNVTCQRLPGHVRIRVRDTGIGIPSEHLPRLFERFYRVDKGRSRAAGGTGLGLSIVKHAVESFGGTVAVESQFGKGSVFTVTLPTLASE
jgi:two-component system, OmpR family, phosphate regulon sensor histidine kinase PhoR